MFLMGHFLFGEEITGAADNIDSADRVKIKQLEPAHKLLVDEVARKKVFQEQYPQQYF